MRRSTLLNKSKSIILNNHIVDNILNNTLTTIIMPVTNKNLYSANDILYCKESVYVVPLSITEEFEKKNNIERTSFDETYSYYYTEKILDLNDFSGVVKSNTKNNCRCFIKVTKSVLCNTDYITDDIAKSLGFENKKELAESYNSYIKYYLDMTCKNECQKVNLFKNIYQFNKNPDIQLVSFERLESSDE